MGVCWKRIPESATNKTDAKHDGRDVAQEGLMVVLDRVCLVRRVAAGPHRLTALGFAVSCPVPCHSSTCPHFQLLGRAFLQQSSRVLPIPMKYAPIARPPRAPLALLSFPQNVAIFISRRCTKRHTCTTWDPGQLQHISPWDSLRACPILIFQ